MIAVCNGDNMIMLEKGANYMLMPSIINENLQLFKWADIVVLQLEIPWESVMESAKIAKENGLTYVFNLAAGSLIYFDEAGSLNLLPLAKKELGIPAEKVAPTQFAQPEQQQ